MNNSTNLSILEFPKFLEELREFWKANTDGRLMLGKREWLRCRYMEIYLRIAYHHIEGKTIKTLDISHVNVFPQFQRQGVYASFLAFVDAEHPDVDALFVENVVMDAQVPLYLKRGYVKSENDHWCYFKYTKPGQPVTTA